MSKCQNIIILLVELLIRVDLGRQCRWNGTQFALVPEMLPSFINNMIGRGGASSTLHSLLRLAKSTLLYFLMHLALCFENIYFLKITFTSYNIYLRISLAIHLSSLGIQIQRAQPRESSDKQTPKINLGCLCVAECL